MRRSVLDFRIRFGVVFIAGEPAQSGAEKDDSPYPIWPPLAYADRWPVTHIRYDCKHCKGRVYVPKRGVGTYDTEAANLHDCKAA